MHEVFAAVRVWQLIRRQKLDEHGYVTGARLFTEQRWEAAWREAMTQNDARDQLVALCFEILHSGTYYDEPSDNIRTIANMELAAITYCNDRLPVMDNWPIYIESKSKPKGLVGIEQVFDVICTYADGWQCRYIGTIDGLCAPTHKAPRLFLDENKTASRLDDGWRRSFEMKHQITGYCAASTAVFGKTVLDARIHGVKIKQGPRSENSYTFEVERTPERIIQWGRWMRHTIELRDRYALTLDDQGVPDFENAPRYTHSCNRYFRPCALIAFCADTAEGRREAWDQMVPVEPSPSEQAIMEQF